MGWKVYIEGLMAVVLILTVGYLFRFRSSWLPKHHFEEPPLVPQRIPYIGHFASLFLQGMTYFDTISARCKAPIYTLNFLSKKLYVVTGPELVVAVARNAKSLGFNPFFFEIGARLTQPDEEARAIIKDNLNGERGQWGYVMEVHHSTVAALGPGKELDSMIRAMLIQSAMLLEKCDVKFTQGPVQLYAWTRHHLTLCSSKAFYGSRNPFDSQPELDQAFWDFDDSLNRLVIDIAPAVIARKGHKGRQMLAQAFKEFYQNVPKGGTSAFAEGRYAVASKYGMATLDMGRLEVGSLLAVLVNTIPPTVYMLYHIFSDKALLEDIRAELKTSIFRETGAHKDVLKFHFSILKETSPLLQSIFHEVLRVYSRGVSSRLVMEDTMLNGQYLLKKGSFLMMPTSVIHSDPAYWGPNDFQARRFLKKDSSAKEPIKRSSAACYRPFGGGATLCPGRHFASAEVLAVSAMMIFKYELTPASGKWIPPIPHQMSLATSIFPPKTDMEVMVSVRPEFKDTRWEFFT